MVGFRRPTLGRGLSGVERRFDRLGIFTAASFLLFLQDLRPAWSFPERDFPRPLASVGGDS